MFSYRLTCFRLRPLAKPTHYHCPRNHDRWSDIDRLLTVSITDLC